MMQRSNQEKYLLVLRDLKYLEQVGRDNSGACSSLHEKRRRLRALLTKEECQSVDEEEMRLNAKGAP